MGSRNILSVLMLLTIGTVACVDKEQNKETIIVGSATIHLDENLLPIIEDVTHVFESQYDAKISLVAKSETETVNDLLNGKADIAILSRRLSDDELKIFERKKLVPRITHFGTDAIAFIRNHQNKDTLVALNDILNYIRGEKVAGIRGLVFDNLNSGTIRQLTDMAGVKSIPEDGVFSFSTNAEAIKYVSENDGMIGVVALNWLSQPSAEIDSLMNTINVLAVKGLKGNRYYSPTQNNLAEGRYPLARDLFVVNCQSFQGLGMGFASFIAGERGQRIILKSGLLPVRIPGRKIITRPGIEKSNN